MTYQELSDIRDSILKKFKPKRGILLNQTESSSRLEAEGTIDGKLILIFKKKKNGAYPIYIYEDVPEEVIQGLYKSESRGKYINQYIKDKYDFTAYEYTF